MTKVKGQKHGGAKTAGAARAGPATRAGSGEGRERTAAHWPLRARPRPRRNHDAPVPDAGDRRRLRDARARRRVPKARRTLAYYDFYMSTLRLCV